MTLVGWIGVMVAAMAPQVMVMNLDVKDGDVLSGRRTFIATVQADDVVTQVEFYVAGELRDTKTSTPYRFELYTLDEPDGPLALRFVGYTAGGKKISRDVHVTIDNEISKGADYHLEKGQKAFQDGALDAAIFQARIVLKIRAGDRAGRMLLARAYMVKGQYDQALRFVQDILDADPNDAEAKLMASSISMKQALLTVNRGAFSDDAFRTITDSVKAAVQDRQKTLDDAIYGMPQPTKDTAIAYADTAFKANRYDLALRVVTPLWNFDVTNVALAERAAYAALRSGQLSVCRSTLATLDKAGVHSAYLSSLQAMMLAYDNDQTAAMAALDEARQLDANAPAVGEAQTYVAMAFPKLKALGAAWTAINANSAPTQVQSLCRQMVDDQQGNFEDGRALFEAMVFAEPCSPDAFTLRAIQSLHLGVEGGLPDPSANLQLRSAQLWFDAALTARPESVMALVGMAYTKFMLKDVDGAIGLAEAAAKVAPEYAEAHLAYASLLSKVKPHSTNPNPNEKIRDEGRMSEEQHGIILTEMASVRRLDWRISTVTAPDPKLGLRYFIAYGRLPLIDAPTSH